MQTFTVPDTCADIPALVDRVVDGDLVVLTRDGRPIAELVPSSVVGTDQPSSELALKTPASADAHAALRRLGELRDSLPPLGMTSVEFLAEMYGEARD